jgi:Leucine-rich repeat (LRR) protein
MEILGAIPNLKTLWLPCNNLANLEMAAAINFPFLEELDLSFNSLSPESVLFLAALPALTQLDLSSNQLTRLPTEVSDMREWWKNFMGPDSKEPASASLDHNRRLTDILSAHGRSEQQRQKQEYQRTRAATFSSFSNRYQVSYAMPGFLKLESLNLENNQLTDFDIVDILGSLQSLKSLNLNKNCIKSLSFILERTYSIPENTIKLENTADLKTPVEGALIQPELSAQSSKESLSMSSPNSPRDTRKDDKEYFPITKEAFNSLECVRGSDSGSNAHNIKRYLGFPSLEELKLAHNQINEVEGLMAIVCLSSLKRVYLDGNPVMNPRTRPVAQRDYNIVTELQTSFKIEVCDAIYSKKTSTLDDSVIYKYVPSDSVVGMQMKKVSLTLLLISRSIERIHRNSQVIF